MTTGDVMDGKAAAVKSDKPQINSELQDSLKNFIKRGTSASRKERRHTLREINRLWKAEATGITDGPLQAIVYHIGLCLPRYLGDALSFQELVNFIRLILDINTTSSASYVVEMLERIGETVGLDAPSVYSRKLVRMCLKISCLVFPKLKPDSVEWKRLIDVQSRLLYIALNTERRTEIHMVYKAMRSLHKFINENTDTLVRHLVRDDSLPFCLGYLAFLCEFAQRKGNEVLLEKLRTQYFAVILKFFLRFTFSSKEPSASGFLVLAERIMASLDPANFKDHLSTHMVKAMLRNPEVVLPAVIAVLRGLKFDLSPYAMEIGKQLGAQLHSKVELSRKLSIEACRILASKCSDGAVVQDLVKHFFGVLTGSEGKITLAAERMDVLSGIGNLSFQPQESLQSSAEFVTSQSIAAITTEAHEQTAAHAVNMLSLWVEKFTDIPAALLTVFKNVSTVKLQSVKQAYLGLLPEVVTEKNRGQIAELLPGLTKIVESAAAKPNDMGLVSEALPVLCVMVLGAETSGKNQSHWTILNDEKKQMLTNEKFLTNCSPQSLKFLGMLVERLLVSHSDKLKESSVVLYVRAFAYVLLRAPHDIRKNGLQSWRTILESRRSGAMSEMLVAMLKTALVKLKATETEKAGAEGDAVKVVNYSKRVIAVLTKIAIDYVELSMSVEDKRRLMVECLLISHEPGIGALRPSMWISLLRRFQHDSIFPDKLIADHAEEIWNKLRSEDELPQEASRNTVMTLMSFPTTESVTKFLGNIKRGLQVAEENVVSLNDFLVFQSPAGTLFDKSVLDTSKEEATKGNIKRESKAYSYKEQMAEMELRKELEEKRKAKAGGKDAPLNAKQKELVTKQIQKEDAVRNTVKKAYEKVSRPFLVLDAMLTGNPEGMRVYISDVINIVTPLLHAPLTAPSAWNTWILLSRCVGDNLQKNNFAVSLAIVTLRVLEPAGTLPATWTQEPLSKAIQRVIHGLFMLCDNTRQIRMGVEPEENGTDAESEEEQRTISVPDGCFALPLLQSVLKTDQSKSLGVKEAVVSEAFHVLCSVLALCAGEQSNELNGFENEDVMMELDENNPAFLPLGSILQTVIDVGENEKGPFESQACTAVNNIAKALVRMAPVDLDWKIVSLLLKMTLSSKTTMRIAAVQALTTLTELIEPSLKIPERRSFLMRRIFIAAHDVEDSKVAEYARDLFQDLGLQPSEDLLISVLEDVTHLKEFVRNSAATAVGILLPHYASLTKQVTQRLFEFYGENIENCKPKVDKFGRPTSEQLLNSWPARRGIALTLSEIAPCLNTEELLADTMEFLLRKPCALKDEKVPVRNDMLQVGIRLVTLHGRKFVGLMLTKFEEFLSNAPKTAEYDVVRQNAVVIMGNLAKHLDAGHPKIRPTVHQLLAALSTPSEEVQKAVSGCIAPLVVSIEEDIRSVVPSLLHVLYESESYAHRRGAAYGLAGVFQGLGILSLKDYDIMVTVLGGLQDKKNLMRREGSLLAIAMLSMGLGRGFEPFVLKTIPFVLQSIGDGNVHVRQAAEEASKAAMSQMSGPGVKMVLPALLKGVEEDAWRAKSAAIEMLGDMAFCAPKQLSSCLPTVVPKLIETLGDSHNKVQESAVSALKKIASVIKNPEVVALVANVLSALQDPMQKTTSCLRTILQTQFIHVIDAASLALLMPVIRRAIYDRGSENRKLSAQIMASLYSLADQKDLMPYLEGILPGLKNCLLDPAPEVRMSAARAIAALVKGTGEAGFEQLKDWLFQKLVAESNSVDRSGAAQGLAESIGVLGVKKLREMMPQFLNVIMAEKTPSHVRDGYLLVFVYLPVIFGQQFTPFISDLIPAILTGLADDTEYVRETALQCGQRIVTFFADTAIELLLPQLEDGMFDENWRIRYASVQLLGDLLYKISGASGKHTTAGLEEDENFGTEQSHLAILHRLGEKHRNRVLAGLYISRSDNGLVVRQAALHVWKVIVTNTPKTLREILPELFEILLDALASDNEERRQVAAKTLGELVRKLGERILPEIIPILQAGLESEADEHRKGVCVGLMEIISSTNKETVVMYCDILEPTLAKALVDNNPGVRKAAAEAFCMLDSVVGHKIMDDILPVLFDKVTAGGLEGDNALDGLQQIMARRSRVVLPYLIPRLITPPVNTRTLALLTAVAGEALSKHLNKVLPALLCSLQTKIGTPDEETEVGYCRSVVLSIDDEHGVSTLVETLMSAAQSDKTRLAAITLLDLFFTNTKVDVRSYFVSIIRPMMRLYMSDDPLLIKKVASVLGTLIKRTPTDVWYENVSALRTAIRAVHMELKVPCVPGLCIPEGASVFIPMLRDALLSVSSEEKEVVGQTIADLVRLSNQNGLKTSVVTITGPIIRILGDRYAPSIRAVMLDALNVLIEKCGVLVKPFVPQIQTTVSRALSDTTRSVRIKAGNVAASIAPMHPRLETLANDLLEVARSNADPSTKETSLRSLRLLMASAGAKLSPQFRADAVAVTTRHIDSEDNDLKNAAAGCLGAVAKFAVDEELANLLKNHILNVEPSADASLQHGRCLALGAALKDAGEKLTDEKYADTTMETILKCQTSDKSQIVGASIRCIGLFLVHQRKTKQPLNKKLLIVLAKSMNHHATEVKQLVAHTCSHLSLTSPTPLDVSELKLIIPQLVNGTKEKNTAVRYDSEMALADVLQLRKDDTLFETVKSAMEAGARDSLQNARKALTKSVMQGATKLEELDETS